jgi:glycosyltransferase involved in cell wall biosynthesis/predicted SAM-dependent methyltransferase
MRIVIDMQGAQTQSRYRGIGRYSLALTQAIVRKRGDHEVILVLSGLFPDTIEPIRVKFESLLPQKNIRVWNAPGPVNESAKDNVWRRETAELIREAFLASLRPDIVHISSLFEGYVDDAVTSIGRFDKITPISVSLYDLIPLLNHEKYLNTDPAIEQYYLEKIEHLKRSHLLLAISEFSRQEGIDNLGKQSASIVNISTAADKHFQVLELSETKVQAIRDKFSLSRPFVLYTGDADSRKNLLRLIRSYAQLAPGIRKTHQLVFAGKIAESDTHQLQKEARTAGLQKGELVFTGYVDDNELVELYNLCKLYVFPSWHEGFGLPALEAMSCGAAVIGANTSSLPEVIDNPSALFDPFSEEDISRIITHALSDRNFRHELRRQGLEQAKKFTWDASACRAIAAFERLHSESLARNTAGQILDQRPKMAYISPLPPERSGISDYSADLLPVLSHYYDIDVIVAQDSVTDPGVNANCQVKTVEWFRSNSHNYERVLYHFGNSLFHQHMFNLLREIPGVVVLHDFFLSGVTAHMEWRGLIRNAWTTELYLAHGYKALEECCHTKDAADVILKYPCNQSVLKHATGIIVHSEYSRTLAKQWYPSSDQLHWNIIPLLRTPAPENDREKVRRSLGINTESFVVCSFGILDPTKQNHRLLESWLSSGLAKDKNCLLIFVGENHGGDYGNELLATIKRSGVSEQIHITGWADNETFHDYLAAADVGVQLRTHSRGETSASVLDCMNNGLPTIINANGSMAELPPDRVCRLEDEFSNEQLVEALEKLWKEKDYRQKLGKKAQDFIFEHHAPEECATQYSEATERFYQHAPLSLSSLIKSISCLDSHHPKEHELIRLSQSIAYDLPAPRLSRQILIDITATAGNNLKTGIERVSRTILMEMIQSPPDGYRIEPVYLSDQGGYWHYKYARKYTLGLLGCNPELLEDDVAEPCSEDILLVADISGQVLTEANGSGLFDDYRNSGVMIYSIIFDLLPVLSPQFFPPGTDASIEKWLHAVSGFDGVICISKTVSDEFRQWFESRNPHLLHTFRIGWFPLGADIDVSGSTSGLPKNANAVLSRLSSRPTFLMVGTIEPRKGYLQTLQAFTKLWDEKLDVNLVGKEGWKDLPAGLRRTIPEIVKKLRGHREAGQRLFWLNDVSDEYLEKLYDASTCLIAASEGEGFGLPLIEAARHKLPIIASDIPVFREVAGEYAHYFRTGDQFGLAESVREFLDMTNEKNNQATPALNWKTWKDSAKALIASLIEGKRTRYIVPKSIRKQAMDEHLNLIHQARKKMVETLLPPGELILDLGGANCPLYKMGYPYHFKKLVLIDLPPEERHEYYKEIIVDPDCEKGEVVIKYNDMTQLDDFQDESVDFVWSGQSIEHIPHEAGKRMCEAAFRVLKKGGAFCLDTPNRLITKIHTRDIGGGFIHPEHCIEYTPDQLRNLLLEAGFTVKEEYGICEMPNTASTGEFCYEDFIYGNKINSDIEKGYILFYHCVK